jgi:L-threonylcarbamoyladenylate synthase
MKHHYMPPVPLILCLNIKKTEAELKEIIQQRLAELPEVIEGIKLAKPPGKVHKLAHMQLSEDPVLAARSFYAQLRELAEAKPDCIVLYKDPAHASERWESLYDRINKATSLIIQD